ncbi:hypothetical protein BHE74_00055251 [Ensete ventricosum]|nr:hypothetical protein BHE74_00055251 [Ensete ventricosum]
MRLNYVEPFYEFLLCFRSKSSEEEGWPATASPHAGPATHGQTAAKAPMQGGDRLRPGPARKGGQWRPQGAAARRVDASRQKRRPRGQQPPAGMAGYGQPAGATVVRGPARGCLPWPALPPTGAAAPTVGVAAPWQGGCQRARAVAACAAAVQRGKRG